MQTKHIRREKNLESRCSAFQLIDLQQFDRLTRCNREFVFLFNPSRSWRCALLDFALSLSLKLSHYKDPRLQSPIPAHLFSAGSTSHLSSSPCFSLFCQFSLFPCSLNVNLSVISCCFPLSISALSFSPFYLFSPLHHCCTSFVLDYLVVSSWLFLPATR